MKKRLISILLATVLILSVIAPTAVFAQKDTADIDEKIKAIENAEGIPALNVEYGKAKAEPATRANGYDNILWDYDYPDTLIACKGEKFETHFTLFSYSSAALSRYMIGFFDSDDNLVASCIDYFDFNTKMVSLTVTWDTSVSSVKPGKYTLYYVPEYYSNGNWYTHYSGYTKTITVANGSGKAGSNLNWTFTPSTNTVSITGSGAMYDYNNYNNPAPWMVFAPRTTAVSLDYRMTKVSVCAFNGFDKVDSITIPKNCTYIDDFAFLNCSSMTKASFVTATHIGHNALAGCSSLKDTYVYIPDCEIVDTAKTGKTLGVPGYTTIHGYTGSTAHTYAKTYGYSFVSMGSVKATGKAGANLTWTYDPETKALSITGSGAMYDYNNYNNPAPWKAYADECTSISLDYQMTKVSVCAFNGFNKVSSITIPKNCTYIDDFAFLNCSSMVKASFVTATHIGHNALAGCSKLKDTYVYIPDCEIVDTAKTGKTLGVPGYTTIHGYTGSTAQTYANTYGYKFVSMGAVKASGKAGANLTWEYDPSTKTLSITGSGAMYDYNNYNNPAPWKVYADECTTISLDYRMTKVSVCAFLGFSKVPSITIPKNCTYIDDFAFLNCSSMVKASFVTATHIGHNALAGCSKLKDTYVYIPDCEIVDTAKTGKTLGVPGYTTIHGYKGSTAETYAKTYGYTFVPMD